MTQKFYKIKDAADGGTSYCAQAALRRCNMFLIPRILPHPEFKFHKRLVKVVRDYVKSVVIS